MTDREAMQMALDALIETVRLAGEYGTYLIRNDKDAGHVYITIEALRARLAQPESEPVAWGIGNTRPTEKGHFVMLLHSKEGVQYPELLIPLYTAPPQSEWIGLTENELSQIHNSANWNHNIDWSFERAIEAKLKEKNT